MKSPIRIDRENSAIIINSSFAKKADYFNTKEYEMLQQVKRDYPEYDVITRVIDKKPNKESLQQTDENHESSSSPRSISIGQLNTSRCLHLRPINS